jgi:penicillin V acylase-like amidase (Ntn superfamily)
MHLKKRHINILLITIVSIINLFITNSAVACSRVLIAPKGQPVMVARTMDWLEDMKTNLWVYPRGINRDGAGTVNSMTWRSKYGSIVATGYDIVITDGMNEKGLAAHVLALPESDYGKRNEKLPGVSVLFWAQYYLDNFQTVDEAIRATETSPFQIEPYFDPRINKWINLHLALEDDSGDSAIIEYVNGERHVYHNRDYPVLTNSPVFDQQLVNLKQYGGFGGDKPLPGTTDPQDRFVRASYYAGHLPAVFDGKRDELAQLMSVIRNVHAPYGISSPERPRAIPTIWTIVSDLTERDYYFNSAMSLNTVLTHLDKFNLQSGAAVMKLDLVNNPDLSGDVTSEFKPVS